MARRLRCRNWVDKEPDKLDRCSHGWLYAQSDEFEGTIQPRPAAISAGLIGGCQVASISSSIRNERPLLCQAAGRGLSGYAGCGSVATGRAEGQQAFDRLRRRAAADVVACLPGACAASLATSYVSSALIPVARGAATCEPDRLQGVRDREFEVRHRPTAHAAKLPSGPRTAGGSRRYGTDRLP